MPSVVPIEKTRGDTRRHTFTITSSSGAVDISTWTSFSLAINTEEEPIDTTNQVEIMNGILATDGTDGKVYFVPAESTPIGEYFYDAQAFDANVEKVTFVKGPYVIVQDRDKS